MVTERTRLAVLGSPIAHSKSPAIQSAAYRELGLPWTYEAIRVDEAGLPAFLDGLGPEWRGLSLTMPLKRDVVPRLATRSGLVDLVGGANTVRIDDEGLHGWNTDVHGIVSALRDGGVLAPRRVLLLGSGATAASVLAALAELGGPRVRVAARTPANAEALRPLAERLGLVLEIVPLEEAVPLEKAIGGGSAADPDLVVSTLPGGAAAPGLPERIRSAATLFDVAYDPWPSALALAWGEAGGRVVPGIEMLLHQAIGQIRCFLTGDETAPLPDEPALLERMRAAVAPPAG